jgi:hypothetical protein
MTKPTTYAVLLPGDESMWEAATPEHRAETYATHEKFATLLAERGHTVTGGAELSHSREARVVRRTDSGLEVTDGPYAETVEQLTGFYLVETDDLDDLVEIVGVLAGPEGGIEIRPVVDHAADPGSGR